MDATEKKICTMLEAEDPELRAAAARVVCELKPQAPPVLASLSGLLTRDEGPARLYALHALAHSPTPEAVGYILPALAGPEQLRQAAITAIVGFGAPAVQHLKQAMESTELHLRKGAATALGLLGGKTANHVLLRALGKDDIDLSRHICFVLDTAIGQMTERQKSTLLGQVEKFLGQKATQKRQPALVSGIILLGMLAAPKAKGTLIKLAGPSHDPEVRRRALLALRPITDSLTTADLTRLLGFLEEPDLANVVLPTIELLRPLPLPAAASARILRLAGSPYPAVRDFAVLKMGRLDTPAAAKLLIGDLDAPDPELRQLAAASLSRNPAATPLLLRRIKADTDPQRLWTLARILEPQATTIPAAAATRITKLLLDALERDDPAAEPLAYLLHHARADKLDAALLKRAKALKAKKRFDQAHRMLRILMRGGTASDDALYEAATVALKVSPKLLSRSQRQADHALRLLDRLLSDSNADLATRLKADKALAPEDMFYAGFHFAEQLRERRKFGGELLTHVVTKHPRAKVAANARNKLRLEALLADAPKPPTKATAKSKKTSSAKSKTATKAKRAGKTAKR